MKALQSADCGAAEGGTEGTASREYCRSRAACDECGEMLHGLNNALASVLLNAQVMAWKLPSYSRSKRYLHEIERNAQRGGELVRRLLERCEAGCQRSPNAGHIIAAVPGVAALDLAGLDPKQELPGEPAEARAEP